MNGDAATASQKSRNYPLLLASQFLSGGALIACLDIKVGFNPSELFLALAAFVFIVVLWLKIPDRESVSDRIP